MCIHIHIHIHIYMYMYIRLLATWCGARPGGGARAAARAAGRGRTRRPSWFVCLISLVNIISINVCMCITIIIIIISMICIIIISSSCSSSFPRAEPPLPHVLPSMGTVSRNIFRRPRDQYLPSTSPRTHFAAGEQTVTTCYFEMLFFHPDGAAEKILAHEHRLITRRTNCIFESHQEAGRVSSTSQRQAREGGREGGSRKTNTWRQSVAQHTLTNATLESKLRWRLMERSWVFRYWLEAQSYLKHLWIYMYVYIYIYTYYRYPQMPEIALGFESMCLSIYIYICMYLQIESINIYIEREI